MTSRKILVLSRHGKKVSGSQDASIDAISDESVRNLYETIGIPVSKSLGSATDRHRTFLRHSDKERTVQTGRAILIGALDLIPVRGNNPPMSVADLENYEFNLDMDEDLNLGYSDLEFNRGAIEEIGFDAYIDQWMRNPDSDTFFGMRVTPYRTILERGRATLINYLERLLNTQDNLGIIVSHSSIIDASTLYALGTESVEEIGGRFNEEDHAFVVIDESQGGNHTASLEYKGDAYRVDIDCVMNN